MKTFRLDIKRTKLTFTLLSSVPELYPCSNSSAIFHNFPQIIRILVENSLSHTQTTNKQSKITLFPLSIPLIILYFKCSPSIGITIGCKYYSMQIIIHFHRSLVFLRFLFYCFIFIVRGEKEKRKLN